MDLISEELITYSNQFSELTAQYNSMATGLKKAPGALWPSSVSPVIQGRVFFHFAAFILHFACVLEECV